MVEMLAFATGIASVWLAVRLSPLTWPTGIASVLCYSLVFVEARLYANALLQLVFMALCVHGWRAWSARTPSAVGAVTRATPRERVLAAAAALAGLAAVAGVLGAATDSPAPLADAAVLSLSLVAVWGQARKKLESWWVWIAVDLIAVPLYFQRGLLLTALLYAVFLALCVAGLRAWRAAAAPPALQA
jgi:nicotinamide mononucleotide transporter